MENSTIGYILITIVWIIAELAIIFGCVGGWYDLHQKAHIFVLFAFILSLTAVITTFALLFAVMIYLEDNC